MVCSTIDYFNKGCFNEIKKDIKSIYGILPSALQFWLAEKRKSETHIQFTYSLWTQVRGTSPTAYKEEVKVKVVCDSLRPHGVAYQAPLSMGFSRQENWSGLPFPSAGDLPHPGVEAGSPALQADSLPAEPLAKRTRGHWRSCGQYAEDVASTSWILSPQTPVWEFQKGQPMWNTLQGQEEELQGGWQVGDRDGGRVNSEGWD